MLDRWRRSELKPQACHELHGAFGPSRVQTRQLWSRAEASAESTPQRPTTLALAGKLAHTRAPAPVSPACLSCLPGHQLVSPRGPSNLHGGWRSWTECLNGWRDPPSLPLAWIGQESKSAVLGRSGSGSGSSTNRWNENDHGFGTEPPRGGTRRLGRALASGRCNIELEDLNWLWRPFGLCWTIDQLGHDYWLVASWEWDEIDGLVS